MVSSVSEGAASVFRVEDEAKTFARNAGNHLRDYTVIQYIRQCKYLVVESFNLLT